MNISYQLVKRLGLHKTFDQKDAFLIFGDPRSGSTWLAELIAEASKRIIIDEPLNLNYAKNKVPTDFGWRQDIPVDQDWKEALNYFSGIFDGKNIPSDCLQKNSIASFISAKSGVYKIIRGNRLLHWLKANFQFRYKPIFLIRHPLAMIHSLSKHSSWSNDYKPYKLPESRNIEVYEKHFTFLNGLQSNEEQILSHWCISNEAYFKNDTLMQEVIVLKYEDLLLDPEKEVKGIFKEWGVEGKMSNIAWRKPSTTSDKQGNISPEIQLDNWKKEMNKEQQRKFNRVLEYFEVAYQ